MFALSLRRTFSRFALRRPRPSLDHLRATVGSSTVGYSSSTSELPAWTAALADADRVIGYPTSFLNLKFLLSEEWANMASYVKQLIGTNHPLLKVAARGLLFDAQHRFHLRGTIVLLVAKACQLELKRRSGQSTVDQSLASSVIVSDDHRSLAEITELIHTAFIIHGGIMNDEEIANEVSATIHSDEVDHEVAVQRQRTLIMGNKLSVLIGDYLLASACSGLARFRVPLIVDSMSGAIASMVQSRECLGWKWASSRGQVVGLVATDRNSSAVWLRNTSLEHATLLSHSCYSAAILCRHSDESRLTAGQWSELANVSRTFGHSFAILFEMCEQRSKLRSLYHDSSSFNRDCQHYLSLCLDALTFFCRDNEAASMLQRICTSLWQSLAS